MNHTKFATWSTVSTPDLGLEDVLDSRGVKAPGDDVSLKVLSTSAFLSFVEAPPSRKGRPETVSLR